MYSASGSCELVTLRLCFSQIKEYKQKVGSLKKGHQMEQNNQQQVLEEARKNASDDVTQIKVSQCFQKDFTFAPFQIIYTMLYSF